MSQYQRILLIADPSMRRTPAFERAVWLARTSGASLHIVLFDRNALIAAAGVVNGDNADSARKAWMDERRAWLQGEAAQLAGHGIAVTSELIWARPSLQDILDYLAAQTADVVVRDVHYESQLKKLLFTSLDWQLLRCCPIPLLLVNTLAHVVPRRVVAAIDASFDSSDHRHLNDQVLKAALALAIQCDAELHMVYAFGGPDGVIDPKGARLGLIGELYRSLLPMHQANFDALAAAHSVPLERRHFLEGPAAKTVASFARADHSDVLVIGAARHTLMERLSLMGTTAEAILDQAPCSVLAVSA